MDLKLRGGYEMRGHGDLLGFKQSGMQTFRLADPVLNEIIFS